MDSTEDIKGRSEPVQVVITSNNVIPAGAVLLNNSGAPDQKVFIYELPTGNVPPANITDQTTFFSSTAPTEGKLYDVTHFGAKTTLADNRVAIQAAIDAARMAGENAVVYLPAGTYVVRGTLRLTGKDYSVQVSPT